MQYTDSATCTHSALVTPHTVNYDLFIKSHFVFTQLTLGPYVVQIWSRYPLKFGSRAARDAVD